MRCTYCGSNKHTYRNCPHTWHGSVRHAQMRCTYCGAHNHEVEACPHTWNGNAARAWYPETVADYFVKDK